MKFKKGSESRENKENIAKKRLPRFAVAFYVVAAACLCLFCVFLISESFSDFFNRYISSAVRAILAYLTGWIPFSFAEMMIILSPVIIIAAVIFATRRYADSWHDVLVFCGTMLSFVALFFGLFTMSFSAGYRGTTLDKKLGIERTEVSAGELYETAMILVEQINNEIAGVAFIEDGFSIMPYNYDEMNDKLIDAYDKACDKYRFIQRLDSNLKPVMLSELMSYTHITGVYSFFTGEANINVNFPDYTIPYTAAHELAHQRGIAREDEANFIAFLSCMQSGDPEFIYSGLMLAYSHTASALNKYDPELCRQIIDGLSDDVKKDISEKNKYWAKYEGPVAEISDSVNDLYLKANDQKDGVKSYGRMVDLLISEFRNNGLEIPKAEEETVEEDIETNE